MQVKIDYNDSTIGTLTEEGKILLDTENAILRHPVIVNVVDPGVDPSDATATSANILQGKTAYIADGTKATGTIETYASTVCPDVILDAFQNSWYTEALGCYILDGVEIPADMIKTRPMVYTGDELQVDFVRGYIPDIMQVSGTTSATDIGTYTITITLLNNYIFSDTKTNTRNYTWTITTMGTFSTYHDEGTLCKTYSYLPGMVWYEFCESEYNEDDRLMINSNTEYCVYDYYEYEDLYYDEACTKRVLGSDYIENRNYYQS